MRPPRQRKSNSDYGWMIIPIAVLFLIVSCGGGTPPPVLPAKAKIPAAEKKNEEPAKVAEQKEPEKKEVEFSYNPSGKPDPFRPFIELSPVRAVRTVPLTPLQKYDISQLKLVAIISAPDGNIALVEDGARKGYFLKKGTWIGKNDGKVMSILKDKVVIEEIYQDVFGQSKKNEVTLVLHQVEEGGES